MAADIKTLPHGDMVTVGAAATLLYTADHQASNSEPINVTVQNTHATAVVTVGGFDVGDEVNGVVLDSQYDAISIPLRYKGATVYAYSDTASTPVAVFVA